MKKFFIILALVGLTGCSTKNYAINEEQITVAKVQQKIKIGMPSAEVVEVLGSPNMITTDEKRRETWVYDRVSTTVRSNSSEVGAWLLIFGGAASASSASSNQRTLTIIVKFDENNLVRDFAYRTSSF